MKVYLKHLTLDAGYNIFYIWVEYPNFLQDFSPNSRFVEQIIYH